MTGLSDTFQRLSERLATLGSGYLASPGRARVRRHSAARRLWFRHRWADEVCEYALYIITVLTAPWLLHRAQHVRIDIVLTLIPPPMAWVMEALGDLFGFVVSLVLVRWGLSMTYDSWTTGSTTIKNLIFPEWWLLSLLPACFLLLAIEFIFRFHRLVTGERARSSDATSMS